MSLRIAVVDDNADLVESMLDVLHHLGHQAVGATNPSAGLQLLEENLPDVGLLTLADAETGRPFTVDTGDRAARSRWEARGRERRRNLEVIFRRHGIDAIRIGTDRSFVVPLVQFFHQRAKRFR